MTINDLKSLSLTRNAKLALREEHQAGMAEVPRSILTGDKFLLIFFVQSLTQTLNANNLNFV